VEPMYPQIRGRSVPTEIFDQVMSLMNEYRSKKAP
jgi:hypothetical protein